MSAILKFDFQIENNDVFLRKIILTTQKRPNFTYDNYIFPKTRGNKNRQWTHSTPLILTNEQEKKEENLAGRLGDIGSIKVERS